MKTLFVTAIAMMLPMVVHAGGTELAPDPVVMAPAPVVASSPNLIFRLGAGVSYANSYFGSKSSEAGPSGSLSFQFLRLPSGKSLGSETGEPNYGFAPRGSFRFVGKRASKDHPELTGLPDVPLSVEIGGGIGYTSQSFEAFADLRYGVIGHQAFVGELGANVVMHPSDRLTVKAGPRVVIGSNKFNDTYFGVTTATGALGVYNPGSGIVSAGLEVDTTYKLDDKWNLDAALRYDQFQGDAKSSPIVTQGSDHQLKVTIGVSRLISLRF